MNKSMYQNEVLTGKLSSVYELSKELTLTADQDKIANAVLDIAQKALDFDNCALGLIDESTNELYAKAQRGYSEEISDLRLPLAKGKGITTWVVRTGDPIYVPDVNQNGRYIPGVSGGRSELAVPLKIGGKVIGVLDVERKENDAFSEEDQKLLSCLASQAAVALENAKNYSEVRRGFNELRTLYDVAVASTSSLKLSDVMQMTYEKLNELMGVSSFHIALYDEANATVHFEYIIDEGEPQERVSFRISEVGGLTGWIIQTRKSLLIKDLEKEKEGLPVSYRIIGKAKLPRSYIGVPLLSKNNLIGVLSVQSYDRDASFDEQDLKVFSVIANQVAITLENARLFTDVEKKTEQLALLLNASTAFSSTLNVDLIFHDLAEKLTTSLPTTFGLVTHLDERAGEFVVDSAYSIRPLEWEPNIGERFPLEADSPYRRCLQHFEPLILREEEQNQELLEFEKMVALSNGLKSLLLVPLMTGSKILGLAWLGEMRNWNRSNFNAEKLSLCRGIAERGAMAIENALLHEQLRENNAYLRREVEERYRFGNIIGKSPSMRRVYTLLENVIASSVRVLIQGEAGTGKEVVAKAIHYSGPRREGRFVAVDCGAIPESLVEDMLFGHRRGAFTGAKEDQKGLFEEADGGTVFLDEIGNMNLTMQAKLLRVLQEEEVVRIGESRPRKVNVRVISATSKNLEQEVRQGNFREDLLFRLNVVTINLPPLRERLEDIPLLATHFLREYSQKEDKKIEGFSPQAMDLLMGYNYRRNNVRELENIVERAVVMEQTHIIKRDSIFSIQTGKSSDFKPMGFSSLQDSERELIIKTLQRTGWIKKETCAILGISRPTLDRKMKRYCIKKGT